MIVFSFFYTTILVLILSALFFLVGNNFLFHLQVLKEKEENFFYVSGLSFFYGIGLFLFFWVLISYISNNARLSLYVILLSFAAYLLTCRNALVYSKAHLSGLKKIIFFLLVFVFFGLARAIVPTPVYFLTDKNLDPFGGFGSVVHSFRAGNLTNYIVENNYFPRVNQNSGQSIIASAPLLLGTQGTQLSLVLWLGIFIAFFTFLMYGFTVQYFVEGKWALLSIAIVLLGNSFLSVFYSSLTDIGSALFLVANYEGLFCIASFLITVILSYEALFEKRFENSWLWVFGMFAFIWNITGAQMILLFLFMLFLAGIVYKKTIDFSVFKKIFFCILFCGVLGSVIQGGMLYPSRYAENPPIRGLMSVNAENVPPLQIRFPSYGDQKIEASATGIKGVIKGNKGLYATLEVIRLLRRIFFPVLGLVLFFFLKKRKFIQDSKFNSFFLLVSLSLFFFGWFVSSFFVLYGRSWELTRFLYFGSFSAMYALGISLTVLLKREAEQKNIKHVVALSLLTIFILFGPSLKLVNDIHTNLTSSYLPTESEKAHGVDIRTLSYPERFSALVTL